MSACASGDARLILLFVRLIERMRRAIAHEYGLPLKSIKPRQTFLSRLSMPEPERQSLHVDESSFPSFHYSGVLYLSTQGVDFNGGGFAFIDSARDAMHAPLVGAPPAVTELSPRAGMAVTFSSGWENMHQVQPLESGCRHAIPAFFVTEPEESRGAGGAEPRAGAMDDAACAEALWRLALRPESEDDYRSFLARWHELLA